MITIRLNERELELPDGTTLRQLAAKHAPNADVMLLNSQAAADDVRLKDGDEVVLIETGKAPSKPEYQSLLAVRHTPPLQKKINQAIVGVAGLGGLGSQVAVALARLGVGRLILVDHDIVMPSNLHRQQYFVDQIGQPKTQALAETLRRINPYVELETQQLKLTADNILTIFADCQVVAECFDDPQAKAMLARTLIPHLPVVAASGLAGHDSANEIKTKRAMKNLYLVGDDHSEAKPGNSLMASRVGVAAGHQAHAVLRLLLGKEP